MAHTNYSQLLKLLACLDDSRNDLYLHLDRKFDLSDRQIDELKKKFENAQSNNNELESKLKTQEQLVAFAKMDQEDIKFRLENEIKELSTKYDTLLKKSENEKKKK